MEIYENGRVETGTSLRDHSIKTFTWMLLGLVVTFVTAFFFSNNPEIIVDLYYDIPMFSIIMIVAQLGVAIALGARIMKMKTMTAKILFIAYSLLTGVTFSVLGYIYTDASIALAFGMTVVFFGSLVLIGYTTKLDLSKIGTICYAGLFAFVAYSLIGLVAGFDTNTYIMSIIGLVLFTGITAWDTQKMKKLHAAYEHDEKILANLSILSAFQLYLDFINIFLYILRLVGSRR